METINNRMDYTENGVLYLKDKAKEWDNSVRIDDRFWMGYGRDQ